MARASRENTSDEKQAADAVSKETEQGFRGIEVDPTPNENYSLAGQNAGAPTPETDPETLEAARRAAAEVAAAANGVAER